MAELMGSHPRAVEVYETFPVFRRGGLLYAVAMELATGTVADAVSDGPWPEKRVVVEIRGLLKAVRHLHEHGALHRDITPMNVFVCGDKQKLKLGDFGITRHGRKQKVPTQTFNWWWVPPDLGSRWSPSIDLWQVAQIACVLLSGCFAPFDKTDVKWIECSDDLKLVLRRALGEPGVRFQTADDFLSALEDCGFTYSKLKSLDGRTVCFTGALPGVKRVAAKKHAERAGARVTPEVSGLVDVLVVGDSKLWLAGSAGGTKVLEALALRERGVPIKFITGEQFVRLAKA